MNLQETTGTHTVQDLPKGWKFQDTPGHGFLYPSEEANKKVPVFLRKHYPYEEDCAYVIPIVCNSTLFTKQTISEALKTFADWYPEEYEIVFQTTLERGQSYMKDQTFARIDNMGKFEKTCGMGDWRYGVPEGYVLCTARQVTENDIKNHDVKRPTGREIEGLIKTEIYRAKQFFDESEIRPFKAHEDYYTWDDYTAATGKERTI